MTRASSIRRIKALGSAQRLLVTQCESARRSLGIAQINLESEQSKLAQLNSYRGEFIQTMRESIADNGMTAVIASRQHAFLAKLVHVIATQESEVFNSEQRLNDVRENWLQVQQREKTVHTRFEQAKNLRENYLGELEEADSQERFEINRGWSR